MEVKINVDESMFKDVLEKELKALTPEQIHEIVCKALEGYLSRPEVMKDIVFDDSFYSGNKHPSTLIKQVFETIDLKSECTEVTSSVMEALKANGGKILIDLVISAFASSMFKAMSKQEELAEMINSNCRETVLGILNNQNR